MIWKRNMSTQIWFCLQNWVCFFHYFQMSMGIGFCGEWKLGKGMSCLWWETGNIFHRRKSQPKAQISTCTCHATSFDFPLIYHFDPIFTAYLLTLPLLKVSKTRAFRKPQYKGINFSNKFAPEMNHKTSTTYCTKSATIIKLPIITLPFYQLVMAQSVTEWWWCNKVLISSPISHGDLSLGPKKPYQKISPYNKRWG